MPFILPSPIPTPPRLLQLFISGLPGTSAAEFVYLWPCSYLSPSRLRCPLRHGLSAPSEGLLVGLD